MKKTVMLLFVQFVQKLVLSSIKLNQITSAQEEGSFLVVLDKNKRHMRMIFCTRTFLVEAKRVVLTTTELLPLDGTHCFRQDWHVLRIVDVLQAYAGENN
jgi:hypothetical protein